jgi:hypothetical protein
MPKARGIGLKGCVASPVEFHLTVPGDVIQDEYEAHRLHADSVTSLALQPWGELAFHAVLLGYRFLIAVEGSAAIPI